MDDRLVHWRCAHRGSLPSTDIRQIPGGCEARIALLTGLGNQNAKRDPRQAQTSAGARAHVADQAIPAAIAGPMPETPLKSFPGPPMTLGSAAAAHLTLIVWCKDCRHQVDQTRRRWLLGSVPKRRCRMEQATPLLAVGSRNVDFDFVLPVLR